MEPLRNLHITPEMLKLIAALDEFKGRWSALGNLTPERLTMLKRVATIESVASSTRIEGVELSNEQVDALLSGLQTTSFRTRDQQEVAGYADAIELVFEAWPYMLLTENHIKQLHGVTLKYSSKDERHRGKYKTVPNPVEAFNEHGQSLGVVFQTATPFDTPGMVQDLVDWTNGMLQEGEHHVLLVIACFVVRFLGIHPFQDGNGRLSRVLTTLLLLRAGYEYVPYSSLERVVEQDKEEYYRALRSAQGSLGGSEENLNVWLLYFLRCMDEQKRNLAAKIEREQMFEPLSELSAAIVRLAKEHGRVTMSFLESATGGNRNTIKKHLRDLVESNLIERHGRGRGTWYQPASRARTFKA
ncbi:MAG: Fic family protein [Oligoflexia bacterium]|nr:Fic family protein [Oligoflexia bacterium]